MKLVDGTSVTSKKVENEITHAAATSKICQRCRYEQSGVSNKNDDSYNSIYVSFNRFCLSTFRIALLHFCTSHCTPAGMWSKTTNYQRSKKAASWSIKYTHIHTHANNRVGEWARERAGGWSIQRHLVGWLAKVAVKEKLAVKVTGYKVLQARESVCVHTHIHMYSCAICCCNLY